MVRHIILWNIREEIAGVERVRVKEAMKRELEGLRGKIDGLLELEVVTRPLPSCNADVMLKSVFTDAQALADYIVHPEHKRGARNLSARWCATACVWDYEE